VTTGPGTGAPRCRSMLEPERIAILGASARPGSFGARLVAEVSASAGTSELFLVNPTYDHIGERVCIPSLAQIDGPVDLVLFGVPDAVLETELGLASRRGDRSGVIFGAAYEAPEPGRPDLRHRLAARARDAGMALCGAGCMGFVNLTTGLRAIGYLEPAMIPRGPIVLVTHSGSVFSALLRTPRRLGYTLAVSSGQELVTTTAEYIEYALGLEETRVIALFLEAMHDGPGLRRALHSALEADVAVVALTVGGSTRGREMVAAHSGALAGPTGAWEALFSDCGVIAVADLDEMVDTLELFAAGRRPPSRHAPTRSGARGMPRAIEPEPRACGGSDSPRDSSVGGAISWPVTAASSRADAGSCSCRQPGEPRGESQSGSRRHGLGTVHDSGAERTLVVDIAAGQGVALAELSSGTTERLATLLDPGLEATNPLDLWGTGARTEELFTEALCAMAADEGVDAIALSVDLVREYDSDDSYPRAALAVHAATTKPFAVLANCASAVDPPTAATLRSAGIPVLEGTRTGLRALGHLLAWTDRADRLARERPLQVGIDLARQRRWAEELEKGVVTAGRALDLLSAYGVETVPWREASTASQACACAAELGYPVVAKTARADIAHKSDVKGVVLHITTPSELTIAADELLRSFHAPIMISPEVRPGVELAVGIVHDVELGPLLVIGAGGLLVELLNDRVMALPPLSEGSVLDLLRRLALRPLLDGLRGAEPVALDGIAGAISAVANLGIELADHLDALDINPLICTASGAIAVDALAVARKTAGPN